MAVSLDYPDRWFDVDDDVDALITTDEQGEMEAVADYLKTYFEPEGYQLNTINLTDTGKKAAGTYSGRENDTPQIDISSLDRTQVMAHEIGHDVFRYLGVPAATGKPYEEFTITEMAFDESFAYLTEKMTADEFDHKPMKHRSPFTEKDLHVWKELEAAIDTERREEEYGYIMEAVEAADAGDDEGVYAALDRATLFNPPIDYDTGLLDGDLLWKNKTNLLSVLPMGRINDLKKEAIKLAGKKRQWTKNPEEEEEYMTQFIDALDRTDEFDTLIPSFGAALYNTAQENKGVDLETFVKEQYAEVLDASIDNVLSNLKATAEEHLHELHNAPEYRELVKTRLQWLDSYGNEFNNAYDFPHRVGYTLASIYNVHDITPRDMLKQPEPFIEYSARAIDYTIDQWLDADEVPVFDPNEMTDYITQDRDIAATSFDPGRPKLLGDGG